ncbi:GMC family oxidoreductase [Paenibacillus sp. LHD-38]|uniref:GMC family oxidoreductase n=1 Tax=Paenibacillus sp. LHD-38 TaxID=3072143 RepID=UPI0028107607|nr:GMC family oxidoreductase [Paenibacillus sp. LHD-38]MDQ8736413.1 GMC family oxidoreductase [Paenibacillus sp. LHD-38]
MAREAYDILIVGTGAGGGTVLWRLCERLAKEQLRIGIIEAGDLVVPTHTQNLPTYNVDDVANMWRNPKYVKYYRTNAASGAVPIPIDFQQPIIFGGGMVHWGTTSIRMDPVDLAEWPVSIREMNYYYKIAERIMNVTRRVAAGSSVQEVMLQRLRENGFPEATDIPMAVDFTATQNGRINSSFFFSSILLIARALNLHSFDLAVKARVTRVLVENGRVSGIEAMSRDKKPYTLRAKTVVLSAGTFGNPHILLHSGVGGNAVGHYLANHSTVDSFLKVQRSAFAEVSGISRVLIPRSADRSYQFLLFGGDYYQPFKIKPLSDEWRIWLGAHGKVQSRYENKVTLDPVRRNEYGIPDLQISFSYSEEDMEIISEMAAASVLVASALKMPVSGEGEVCLRHPGGENHEMGTCRMGENPETSVTDRFGRIHGILGLFAADNSVLPTSGTANPTLSTVALAIRTADYISEQLK